MNEALGTGPLAGIRVVDLATDRGAMAGRVLAELGAEVVLVEPPGGSPVRRLPPFAEGREDAPDASLHWAAVAARKRSVVLDVGDARDCARLVDLVRSADILVESSDPGEMERRGLGYRDLREVNPGLIYVSVTPYGQTGPDAHSPATDLTLEAAGGLLGLQGDGDRPPVPVGYPQAAFHAGVQAAADAVIALYERERSGLGQHLDVSMQSAVVCILLNATGYPPNAGSDPPGTGELRAQGRAPTVPGLAVPTIWRCADGYLSCQLAAGAAGTRTIQGLMGWIEAEGTLDEHLRGRDWRAWLLDVREGRLSLDDARRAVALIEAYFQRFTQQQWLQRATEEDLLIAPLLTIDHILEDPHLAARQFWVEVDGVKRPGPFVRLSRHRLQVRAAPAHPGQDQALLDVTPAPRRARPAGAARGQPFEGLRVADFSWIGVGPMVAKALADHGATVVHVESATRPDLLRTVPPFKDNEPGLDRAQFMANFNTSKLGLSLNLASEAGRALGRRLIDWADVVLESFTPGTFAKLGYAYEDLARDHAGLVMMSTCLRGQTGPQRSYGGYGGQGAALAGIAALTGWPDRPPAGPWGAYTDFVAPRFGVAALSSALLDRERTGRGQHIDLSQVETGIRFIEPLVLDYTVNGRVARAAGHESLRASPHGVYRVAGIERYVAIACETDAQWDALHALARFEGFALRTLDERLAHDAEIDDAVGRWCAEQEPWDLVARLKRAGVPASVVLRPSDLYHDPQLAHRGFFVTLNHAVMGPTPYDGPVTLFSDTPPRLTAAPALGQHTQEVLRTILGLAEDEVARHASQGAFD